MDQPLKKLAASLSLHYSSGTSSKSLVATDFRLDDRRDGPLLRLNLSSNLESRNHGLPCYRDARLFLHDHTRLREVWIHDRGLSSILQRLDASQGYPRWQVELKAGRCFFYSVLPSFALHGTSFAVDTRRMCRLPRPVAAAPHPVPA